MKEIEDSIRELPFILSGEYRLDCSCEHCNDIPKNIKTALAALRTLEWIEKTYPTAGEYSSFKKDGDMIMDKFTSYLKGE